MPKMIHTCLMHQIYVLWKRKICIVETLDLYCVSTRSVLWKHKIRIVRTLDLHLGNTRSGL